MHVKYSMAVGASSRLRKPCTPAPLAAAVALCLAGVAQAATITVNDSRGDSANPNDTTCSLSDAVAAVNQAAHFGGCAAGDGNNDRIVLSIGTPATILFSVPSPNDNNSALSISKPVSIIGASDANHAPLINLTRSAVSGTPNFRLLATSSNLTLDGFSFVNGSVVESGGAIRATGYAALSLSNTTVSSNSAVVSGGGVAVDCGPLSLYRSTVSGNTAAKNGGGIYVSDYVKNSGGGSTTCINTTMNISRSTVRDNTVTGTDGSGGGAFSFNGYATVSNSTISGNTTPVDGGGIYAFQGVQLIASTISNNTGQNGSGGGVWSNDVSTNGGSSIVSANTAYMGAGIYAHTTNLSGITVSDNTSVSGGGGIHSRNDATIVNSTIANNSSGNCECRATGGLFAGSATVTNSTFSGNFGGFFGYGALYAHDVTLYFNTVVANTAMPTTTRAGGVAFFGSGHMVGNIISGNSSNDVYTYPRKTLTGGYNIITTSGFVTLPADTITNCSPSSNLHLGPLANNGGPTQTMALLTDSCAINAGPDTTPLPGNVSTDQRGLPRPVGVNADIGAFELQPDKIFVNGFE
jgi:predicted outer membrane repeat protein